MGIFRRKDPLLHLSVSDKVFFITGATRGIGRALALRAAKGGAKVVVLGKSVTEGKLPGTIFSVAAEIEALGGQALPIACDIRFEEQVQAAIDQTIAKWGRIDVLVNNASAIDLRGIDDLPMKQFDLINDIDGRGAYLCAKLALPHLRRSEAGHIITLSPPLDMDPRWFNDNLGYTIAKYGMSMVTIGLGELLKGSNVGAVSVWPQSTIKTAAVSHLGGKRLEDASRTEEIMVDAIFFVIMSSPQRYNGQCLLDVVILRQNGVGSFGKYSVVPGGVLRRDLFVRGPIYFSPELFSLTTLWLFWAYLKGFSKKLMRKLA